MNITFFMEQHIGHRSYYENLRRFVDRSAEVNARWIEITYQDSGYWWNRLPVLPASLRGTLNGRAQVRNGLQHSPASIAFFNTQVPAAVPDWPGITTYQHLRPNTQELLALYHACDVFVLPTRAEAFGIAAVEASAAGLPIIATAVGGLTDIVADRQSGFLIANNDVDALIYRLQLLAESPDLRQKLGRAARKRAELCFDARHNAARILEILFEIVIEASL